MQNEPDYLEKYFGVLIKGSTYLNLVYLSLAFPLGLFYFVSIVVGLSVGLSLIIIWVGLLILALLFPAIWAGIAFERTQAIHLLKQDIPPMAKPSAPNQSLLEKTKDFFLNPVTWKGLFFLLLKFPIGIFEFTVVVTGISIVGAFIAAPFIFPWVDINLGYWVVDSFSEAVGLMVLGVLILPAVFHLFNLIAQLNGKLAKIMLGQMEFSQSQMNLGIAQESQQSTLEVSGENQNTEINQTIATEE